MNKFLEISDDIIIKHEAKIDLDRSFDASDAKHLYTNSVLCFRLLMSYLRYTHPDMKIEKAFDMCESLSVMCAERYKDILKAREFYESIN